MLHVRLQQSHLLCPVCIKDVSGKRGEYQQSKNEKMHRVSPSLGSRCSGASC